MIQNKVQVYIIQETYKAVAVGMPITPSNRYKISRVKVGHQSLHMKHIFEKPFYNKKISNCS